MPSLLSDDLRVGLMEAASTDLSLNLLKLFNFNIGTFGLHHVFATELSPYIPYRIHLGWCRRWPMTYECVTPSGVFVLSFSPLDFAATVGCLRSIGAAILPSVHQPVVLVHLFPFHVRERADIVPVLLGRPCAHVLGS
ncbi:MAG: hypothetical protein OXE86_14735 [Alphaproteobacteria bacterium]|nr:hypothetical protein [Alphaproteobacteria bacterium]